MASSSKTKKCEICDEEKEVSDFRRLTVSDHEGTVLDTVVCCSECVCSLEVNGGNSIA
jgi:hypothetical protein